MIPAPAGDLGQVTWRYSELAHAYSYHPRPQGRIRAFTEDFEVEEQLTIDFSGDGEHAHLLIEKRGENSEDVARMLAKYLQIPRRNVGYAGMKDKHALTRQWFSAQIPGRETPSWRSFETDRVRVLESHRHFRKLKTGALASNTFNILIRDLSTADHAQIERKLRHIAAEGVPNYFGPQRFGNQAQNIDRAAKLFEGKWKVSNRHRRGLYLSAARSLVFNEILSKRVEDSSWNKAIAGDAFNLDGSRAFFKPDSIDLDITHRLGIHEIHPTGPLWGRGANVVTDQALDLERAVCHRYPTFCKGLEDFGLDMGRRPLRMRVSDFTWSFPNPRQLRLAFRLAPGCYATSVIREIIDF